VNLSGNYESAASRNELAADPAEMHKLAFQHVGRFDSEALNFLDSRNAAEGDQFRYRRNADGQLGAQIKDPMSTAEFQELLAVTEERMREFARRIFDGDITVNPYKKGGQHACKWCEHAGICRIDPWSHQFRKLNKVAAVEESDGE